MEEIVEPFAEVTPLPIPTERPMVLVFNPRLEFRFVLVPKVELLNILEVVRLLRFTLAPKAVFNMLAIFDAWTFCRGITAVVAWAGTSTSSSLMIAFIFCILSAFAVMINELVRASATTFEN